MFVQLWLTQLLSAPQMLRVRRYTPWFHCGKRGEYEQHKIYMCDAVVLCFQISTTHPHFRRYAGVLERNLFECESFEGENEFKKVNKSQHYMLI